MKELGRYGMRPKVMKALRPLDPFPVENRLRKGTPDVNYAYGWLELKVAERPARSSTPVRVHKFYTEQRTTLLRRSRITREVRVLLLLDEDWLLLPGGWAAENLGFVVEDELWRHAERAWRDKLDEAELLNYLKESGTTLPACARN